MKAPDNTPVTSVGKQPVWRVLGTALALLFLSAPFNGAQAAPPAAWKELLTTFDSTLEKDSIVGGSVALVEKGRIVSRHHYGYADRASGRKVDENTVFHWASITKTLNAIAIMQLRDAGKLTLDDPVTRLLPELRQMHNPFGSMDAITVRMLLNHSAGFQAPTWPYKQGLPWEPFEPTRWEQLVAMMPYQQVEFAPGSKFSYSNPAWIYAARILELSTGDHWQYYMQKNIFTPLEMTRSYFGHTPNHLRAHRSHRYIMEKSANGALQAVDHGAEFDPGITIPNGGWNSPLDDVAAYIAFLTAASGRNVERQARFDTVLRRSTLEEMWRPQLPLSPANSAEHMGYAFFLDGRGGARLVGHTGGQGGFSSFFHVNPANGRGIVAAFNTAGQGDAFSKLQALAKQALRQ